MKEYKSKSKRFYVVSEKTEISNIKITSSQDMNNYVRQFYFDDIEVYESMFLVLLNRNNCTVGFVKISQGGTAGTVVDIKLIAKYALESLSHSVILVHNHPSGNLMPSDNDISITGKVKRGLVLLEIQLLDHLIIIPKSNKYYSFSDNNLI